MYIITHIHNNKEFFKINLPMSQESFNLFRKRTYRVSGDNAPYIITKDNIKSKHHKIFCLKLMKHFIQNELSV